MGDGAASDLNSQRLKKSNNGAKMDDGSRENREGPINPLSKVTFQLRLIWTLYSMGVYVNKIYEDCSSVADFYREKEIHYTIVTGLCLILPTVAYTVYVVADHLNRKKVLPEIREVGSGAVHGLLLIPWQIKSRADQLHFISPKCCQMRAPSTEEEKEMGSLEKRAAVLEFFEEFIAGFIQLILQCYIILLYIQTKKGRQMIISQVVASGLSLFSMILAVKRRDDGILTGFLSTVGWTCMFVSRAFTIALGVATVHLWMILFCILHVLAVTVWLTKLALDSYRLAEGDSNVKFTHKKKISTFVLIFTLFGFPSLSYWPMMFQLRQSGRPLIFIGLMLIENAGLFCLWYFLGTRPDGYLTPYAVLSGLCVIGALFICFYNCVKPKGTDKVVQYDMKGEGAFSFGLYFDFCNAAFHLPEDDSFNQLLQEVRQTPST